MLTAAELKRRSCTPLAGVVGMLAARNKMQAQPCDKAGQVPYRTDATPGGCIVARAGPAGISAPWRRPSSAKDMLRLKQDALVNSDRLARFLAQVVVQLTPTAAANESR